MYVLMIILLGFWSVKIVVFSLNLFDKAKENIES